MKKLSLLAMMGATVAGLYACAGEKDSEISGGSGGSGPATGGQGGEATDPTSSGIGGSFVGQGGSSSSAGGSCNSVTLEADPEELPADIIVVIDNSGSMSEELDAVEQNINVNLASILHNATVDYQVIMVTDHGNTGYDLCVGPPLSATTNCAGPPVEIPNRFYHYDVNVQSWDSACIFLDTLYGPNGGGNELDENGNHPNGWAPYLRTSAIKFVVEITDDRMNCSYSGTSLNDSATNTQFPQPGQIAAVEFDSLLLQKSPAQFGTTAKRNYRFYSIVGVESNPLNPTQPYPAGHPYISAKCSSAQNSGPGYQWLSKGTNGWRFPVCNYQDYSAIFQKIAEDVIVATSVPCEFDLPEAPDGFTYNLDTVSVLYTPDGMSMAQKFTQVASAAACNVDTDKFYIENDRVYLCPAACTLVTNNSSPDAKVEVDIQCGFIPE